MSNATYTSKLAAPLLRPGMTIEVGPVSGRYVVREAQKALEIAKQINAEEEKTHA